MSEKLPLSYYQEIINEYIKQGSHPYYTKEFLKEYKQALNDEIKRLHKLKK